MPEPEPDTLDPVEVCWLHLDRTSNTDRTSLGLPPTAALLALLDPAERERAHHLDNSPAFNVFVHARAGLRLAVAERLGVLPEAVAVTTTKHGKPVIANAELHVSVAHTHTLIALALHRHLPVGIDVEQRGREVDEGLIPRVCTEDERRTLAALDPGRRAEELLRLWVRKEAVAKADGRGLAIGLTNLEVSHPGHVTLPPAPMRATLPPAPGHDAPGDPAITGLAAYVEDVKLADGYHAAVATLGAPAAVIARPWLVSAYPDR